MSVPIIEAYRRGRITPRLRRKTSHTTARPSDDAARRQVSVYAQYWAARNLTQYLGSGSNDTEALLEMVSRTLQTTLELLGRRPDGDPERVACRCTLGHEVRAAASARGLGTSRLGRDLTAGRRLGETVLTLTVRGVLPVPGLLRVMDCPWRLVVLEAAMEQVTPLYMDWHVELLPQRGPGREPRLGRRAGRGASMLGCSWALAVDCIATSRRRVHLASPTVGPRRWRRHREAAVIDDPRESGG